MSFKLLAYDKIDSFVDISADEVKKAVPYVPAKKPCLVAPEVNGFDIGGSSNSDVVVGTPNKFATKPNNFSGPNKKNVLTILRIPLLRFVVPRPNLLCSHLMVFS